MRFLPAALPCIGNEEIVSVPIHTGRVHGARRGAGQGNERLYLLETLIALCQPATDGIGPIPCASWKPGDKVGIWAKNVPDWTTLMFATAKIGAILVTINTNYKLAELDYLLKNADINTLFLVDGYRDSDYVKMMFELVPELNTQARGELQS